jgi:hypothetical protein
VKQSVHATWLWCCRWSKYDAPILLRGSLGARISLHGGPKIALHIDFSSFTGYVASETLRRTWHNMFTLLLLSVSMVFAVEFGVGFQLSHDYG